jgi:hypothetical protein
VKSPWPCLSETNGHVISLLVSPISSRAAIRTIFPAELPPRFAARFDVSSVKIFFLALCHSFRSKNSVISSYPNNEAI